MTARSIVIDANSGGPTPGSMSSHRCSTSLFTWCSTPIGSLARMIGVGYVIEGSVRQAPDRVRITAQLSDGSQIWAERYDRKLAEVFAVQDDITSSPRSSRRCTRRAFAAIAAAFCLAYNWVFGARAREASMLILYYWSGASSLVPHIVLEEIGAPYERQVVNLAQGEHKSGAYLKINPHGKVPALAVDGMVLTENVAILTYLAKRFPETQLLPPGIIEEAHRVSMMAWFASSVHPTFASFTSGLVYVVLMLIISMICVTLLAAPTHTATSIPSPRTA